MAENTKALEESKGRCIIDFSLEENCNAGYCDSLVLHLSEESALYIQSLPGDFGESELYIEFKTKE